MRRVATALLHDLDGRILLQDRTSISKFGERWGPFGGSIDKGESPIAAVRRELVEEIGVSPQCLFYLGKYTGRIGHGDFEEHVFFGPAPAPDEIDLCEGDGFAFFEVEALRDVKSVGLLPSYNRVLADLTVYWSHQNGALSC